MRARRLNECPLGAAALAGTSFPIDRHMTAEALGFDRPAANSLDAVSDRDFALETLAAAAIAAVHLSRFAEEIVLWTTPQFGFVKLSDKFTTGSSIMPQKRNPDAAELMRAKVGRIAARVPGPAHGHEGPAARLFQGHAGGQGAGLRRPRQPGARRRRHDRHGRRHGAQRGGHAGGGRAAAIRPPPTSPTGWCGPSSCRSARPTTSRAASSQRRRRRIYLWTSCPLAAMQAVEPRITADVFTVLSPEKSVASRTSYGGTAPQNVRKMAQNWRKRLEKGAFKALEQALPVAPAPFKRRSAARAFPASFGTCWDLVGRGHAA